MDQNHPYWPSQPKPVWHSLILQTFPLAFPKRNAHCGHSERPEEAVPMDLVAVPVDAGPWQGCWHTTNPCVMADPLLQTNDAARLNTGLLTAPRELQLLRDVRNFCNNSQRVLSLQFSSSLLNPINHPTCRTSAITQPLRL